MNPMPAEPNKQWRLGPDARSVSFGDRTVLLAEVAGHETGQLNAPNIIGHLMAVGVFFIAGAILIEPVALMIARPKFLLGGGLFVCIGITALGEILRARAIQLHHVDISLKNGETVRFTSNERAQVEALSAVLQRH